jgi:hypothetical protein
MALTSGTRLGAYEIHAAIHAGSVRVTRTQLGDDTLTVKSATRTHRFKEVGSRGNKTMVQLRDLADRITRFRR